MAEWIHVFLFSFQLVIILRKKNTNYQKLIGSVLLTLLISTLIIKCSDNH